MPRPVRVGLIGAGFAADVHANSYAHIGGLDVQVVGVAARTMASAERFAANHGIPQAYDDAEELISRADVNLIDLCVPNALHEPLVLAAAQAGKHVVCEKPLTGYFGGDRAAEPVGATPRRVMLADAVARAERMLRSAEDSGVRLMYAENWLYMPAVVKASRLAAASEGSILEIRGQECHSGSHAEYAKSWALSGGGALVRLGSHPIGAALWLKSEEGRRRDGVPIVPVSVVADVADMCRSEAFLAARECFVVDDWRDVENWASLVIAFGDGSRAVIQASDIVLGGMEDSLQLMLTNGRINCNMTHSGMVTAFSPHADVFADEYIMEKVSTKAGWSHPSVDEEFLLGYPQEVRDFAEAVAYDRAPRSTAQLGLDVVRVMYAAYQSAEEGRRIFL